MCLFHTRMHATRRAEAGKGSKPHRIQLRRAMAAVARGGRRAIESNRGGRGDLERRALSKGADPADEGMLVNLTLPPSPLFVRQHNIHLHGVVHTSGGQLIWADLEDWYSNFYFGGS